MKGRTIGAVLLVAGAILMLINIKMMNPRDPNFTKLLIGACSLAPLGIAMMIAPGAKNSNSWWKETGSGTKVFWILILIVGAAGGVCWANIIQPHQFF